MDWLQKILSEILQLAGVNPLAAVVILFILLTAFVAYLTYLFVKDKRVRKEKEQSFIYSSGLWNNFEINIRKMFEELKEVLQKSRAEDCYFVKESGETRRGVFFDQHRRIQAIEKDIGEIKLLINLKRDGN